MMIRLTILFVLVNGLVCAQRKPPVYKHSILHLGFFPGLSTNGLNPGEFDNDLSISLISGYGHRNRILEINGITGFNTASSTGIQFSGIADFIGGNGQVGLTDKEKRMEKRSGYETSLTGIQVSGLYNYVGSNVSGGQITVGINRINNYLIGAQFGGMVNYVGGFTIGTQIALLGNYSKKSMSGVQVSLLINYTNGSYSGIQLGAFNHAGVINSIKGPGTSSNTALQIGIINTSGNMGGTQIGLINIGDRVTGTQIGLINIFKSGKSVDYPDKPAFGLLNFGYFINPRAYTSDFFVANYGLYTGKPLNSRVRAASRTYYAYNEITYATNYSVEREAQWGVSYKAGIISFYKSADVTNQRNYFKMDAEIGHFNRNKKYDKKVHLKYAVNFEVGLRLARKVSWVYPFVGVSYNYTPQQLDVTPEILASTTTNGSFWMGYSAGLMLH